MSSASNQLTLWLESHRRWIFWCLLALGLVTRGLYVVQFLDSPCREWHRWPDSDMAFFDDWSQNIAAGNWLQREPRHPFHSWHAELAELTFRQQATNVPGGISPEVAARSLWNRWYGGVRFHQEPLYPYTLALIRCVTSHFLAVLLTLQLLAGIGTTLLIWDIARRCFGPLTGAVAGLLAALSPTLLYLGLVLLRESFISCTGLGLVWLALWAESTQSRRAWSILGLACGGALLLKATLVVFAFGCATVCLLRIRRQPTCAIHLGLFTASLVLGMSPAIVRNLMVRAPIFSLSSVATITFVNTNAADSDALGFPISREHAPRIMSESNGSLVPAMFATWRTHTPTSLTHLMWQKWQGLWNWFEAPDNISFSFFRLQMPVLRWLPVTFAVIAPLSLVGIVLGAKSKSSAFRLPRPTEAGTPTRCWPLYLLVGNHVLVLMLFTQVGRLRVPLVAALVPFAAITLVHLYEWLSGKSRVKGTLTLMALILAGLWTFTGTPAGFTEYRAADFLMAYQLHYNPQIATAAKRDDWKRVTKVLEDSLQREPAEIRNLQAGATARNRHQHELAQVFAGAHAALATALEKMSQSAAAIVERRRGAELQSIKLPSSSP